MTKNKIAQISIGEETLLAHLVCLQPFKQVWLLDLYVTGGALAGPFTGPFQWDIMHTGHLKDGLVLSADHCLGLPRAGNLKRHGALFSRNSKHSVKEESPPQ